MQRGRRERVLIVAKVARGERRGGWRNLFFNGLLSQLCGKINFTITKEREERWIAVIRETARGGEDEITGRGAIASRL